MQLPIKGKREKESISEIRSKPIPADVTAKIVLISHPFARRYRTGAVPRPVSLKAAISARTNAPERAESISGHPAPGTLRLGRTEPYRRLRIRTISAARAKPYAPAPFGRVRRKRRNRSPNNRGRNACALPFAVCTNVPVLIKESYLCHTEGGARPRAAIRRTCGRVRTSVGTTSPTATGKTPVLGNFQSVRLFRRTWTHSTARFASALPAAKGRRTPPSPSVWKARFTNLFAEKIPPLPSYGGISYPS